MESHFSFTRNSYDQCELEKKYQESTHPFKYTTDTIVSENNDSCFLNASPFMHNQFRSIPRGVVDIESELRGQTRILSNCPSLKYNPHNQEAIDFKVSECTDKGLIPEYTRVNKPCNIFAGITINRFHPLCDDLQNLNNIHSNKYIGNNTRLQVKDAYSIKHTKSNPPFIKDLKTPCFAGNQACAFLKY